MTEKKIHPSLNFLPKNTLINFCLVYFVLLNSASKYISLLLFTLVFTLLIDCFYLAALLVKLRANCCNSIVNG